VRNDPETRKLIGAIVFIVGILFTLFEFAYESAVENESAPTSAGRYLSPDSPECISETIMVSGHVTNTEGRSLPDVTVTLDMDLFGYYTATSKADGLFVMDEVDLNDCVPLSLMVTAEGYRTIWIQYEPSAEGWLAEIDFDDLDFELELWSLR
jgi:hypothetical protein